MNLNNLRSEVSKALKETSENEHLNEIRYREFDKTLDKFEREVKSLDNCHVDYTTAQEIIYAYFGLRSAHEVSPLYWYSSDLHRKIRLGKDYEIFFSTKSFPEFQFALNSLH